MNQERGLSVVRDFTVASVAAEDGFLAADGQQIMADGIVKCDLETGDIEFVHSGQEAHEIRALIMRVQRSLEALPYQTEFVVEHEFCDGMYLRKLHIPKGTLLIGKIHKQPCMNIVAKGDIAILTETGAKRVTAGFSVPSRRRPCTHTARRQRIDYCRRRAHCPRTASQSPTYAKSSSNFRAQLACLIQCRVGIGADQ